MFNEWEERGSEREEKEKEKERARRMLKRVNSNSETMDTVFEAMESSGTQAFDSRRREEYEG